jgi:hypothetical protein
MDEGMDLLHWHIREVEKLVFIHTPNLFNLSVDPIFRDTTTASLVHGHIIK